MSTEQQSRHAAKLFRERIEVAHRIHAGQTHYEIGNALKLSSSTVLRRISAGHPPHNDCEYPELEVVIDSLPPDEPPAPHSHKKQDCAPKFKQRPPLPPIRGGTRQSVTLYSS